MVNNKQLKLMSDGTYDVTFLMTLEKAYNLCPSEAFGNQYIAPSCSGFLVAPDILVTAGHCYTGAERTPKEACAENVWVFDYDMKSASFNPTQKIPADNVYKCKEVLSAELSMYHDFSIVKLDRPVVGRAPLKFRTTGKIANTTSLVVIGHPSGLPTKIADGGKITRNTDSTKFSTNLDTFAGNSGSAVFDAKTGIIEGILVQGKTDYALSNPFDSQSCRLVNKCDENGNSCQFGNDQGPVQYGEVVVRIESLNAQLSRAIKGK